MDYHTEITVPANTLDTAPQHTVIKLTTGVIQKMSIQFPPGPHGMVKVRIMEGNHQFLPTNPDGYYASDNETIQIEEWHEMKAEPFSLVAVTSSPGTSFDHTIHIRGILLRPDEVEASSGLMSGIKKFLQLVGIGK